MHGFKQVLIDWLLELQPRRIVEWGPGLSTELMLQHAPQAEILSIEHDEAWLAVAAEKYGGRIQLEHHRCTNRNSDYAACILDREPFDLAFVDGRRRVECVLTALPLLAPGGVVILHDICRQNYMRPLTPYIDVIETRANTAVMRLKK
jgi:predicted O-methyltransferase YrrM